MGLGSEVVQEHHYAFDVDASPEDIWEVFWYHGPDKPMTPGVKIEILHPGNEIGNGLVRHCHFPVPKFLGTRGIGQSWEWVTEVVPNVSSHYTAIGKPLWSRAEGEHRLERLPDGRTLVHFMERYHVFNPLMRVLLEQQVHHFISKDNDKLVKAGIERGLAAAKHSGVTATA